MYSSQKKEDKKTKENEENTKKIEIKDDNTNSMDSSEDILKTINKIKINESKEEDEKSLNLGSEINNKTDDAKKNDDDDFFDDDFEGLNFGSNDFFNTIFEKDDKRENDVESYEEMDYNTMTTHLEINYLILYMKILFVLKKKKVI